MSAGGLLRVDVPGESYHRDLISCQEACPVHTDARGYVRAIAAGRFEEAYLIARGPNPLASICGRICGAPCEAACRRGKVPRVDADGRFVANDRPIAIRALKRFACEQAGPESRPTDEVLAAVRSYVPDVSADADELAALVRAGVEGAFQPGDGQSIAIIGAGPAGLSAAHDLALMGFRPVVFESEPVPAGMLAVGVPAYRLPRELIAREVAVIERLGVEIRCGMSIGSDISLAQLRKLYAAVIIAVGAKSSRRLGLPGEVGPRVYGGVDLLRAVALGMPLDLGREVVVVGGGNVAYDVARTVLRQIAYDTARTAARLLGTVARSSGLAGNARRNAGRHAGDPRRRRRGHSAAQRLGTGRNRTRPQRSGTRRRVSPVPASVRRQAPLRTGVRRPGAAYGSLRHGALVRWPIAELGLPRRRRRGHRAIPARLAEGRSVDAGHARPRACSWPATWRMAHGC